MLVIRLNDHVLESRKKHLLMYFKKVNVLSYNRVCIFFFNFSSLFGRYESQGPHPPPFIILDIDFDQQSAGAQF